jgi:hypothetical protein
MTCVDAATMAGMDPGRAGAPGPGERPRDRLTWRADDEARRDWLWSQAYIVPVGVACVAVSVAGVLARLGSPGVGWIVGAVIFALTAAGVAVRFVTTEEGYDRRSP